MLRIIRYGFETPGVDVAHFEFDRAPTGIQLPRLVHFEHHADANAALTALGPNLADVQTVSICPCVTEVLKGVEADHFRSRPQSQYSDVQAEYRIGGALLATRVSSAILANVVGQSALAEPSCLIAAFRASYSAEIYQFTQLAHLHVSEKQIDVFVYDRGELVHHEVEIPEDSREGVEDAANLLLSDPNGRWRRHLDFIVVSGASKWIQASRLEWLDPQVQKDAQAKVFDSGRLYRPDLTDADAQREFDRQNGPFFKSALPVLLAGAARAVADAHAADFRRVIPSEPRAQATASFEEKVKGFFSGAGAKTPAYVNVLGLIAGLVVAAGLFGWQWRSHAKRESAIKAAIALEQKREADNMQLESEAKKLRQLIEALNNRIQIVNKMRESQNSNYLVTNNVTLQIPQGLILSKLELKGRNLLIEGYVTAASATLSQPAPAPTQATPPPSPPGNPPPQGNPPATGVQPAIDKTDLVTTFVTNLQNSNLYSNIQSNFRGEATDKSTFIVTCTYVGEIFSDPLDLQPIPELVQQAAPPTRN